MKFFLLFLLLFATFYSYTHRAIYKPKYGYGCIEGEVAYRSYNKVWLNSEGRFFYFYTKRPIYPTDSVEVCGTFKGLRIKPKTLKVERNFLQKLRLKIRYYLKGKFFKIAKSKVEKKLISALVFGDNYFSRKEKRRLSHLGIYHLIVISGMHYAFLFTFFLVFPVRWKLRYWFALAFLSAFTFLLLFPKAPAYRAFLSFALFLTAKIFERNYSSFKALFWAYALSLFLFPFWLTNVGFWLSYLASLSLILYYGGRKVPEESFLSNLFGKFLGLEAVLVVSVVIAPLIASQFHFFGLGSFLYTALFSFVVQIFLLVAILNVFTFFSLPPLVWAQNSVADFFGYLFYNLPTFGVFKVESYPLPVAIFFIVLALGVLKFLKRGKLLAVGFIFLLEILSLFLFNHGDNF